jgi:hypothetical protein
MKKIIRNNKILAIALFTLFTTTVSATGNPVKENPNPVPAELSLVGSFLDKVVFKLDVAGNAEQNDFTISITDQMGQNLYRENIKGENFTKKFLLNYEEIGDNILYFEITCWNNKKKIVYEISNKSTYVQKTIIEKK